MNDPIQRLDKWLWCARFFKTRSLAAELCNAGKLRVGGQRMEKAHYRVKLGDVLTFPQGSHIRVIRVLALAGRRGPPAEARTLYDDLAPAAEPATIPDANATAARDAGTGRPTKADRRAMERLRGGT